MSEMTYKVLVACEESQTVCKAFRARGFESYSCDIQEPSGGHPEWHILGDALKAIEGGQVVTMDGKTHDIGKWDLLIAHPPCTYLSNVATRSFSLRCTVPEKVVARWVERAKGAVFLCDFRSKRGANSDRKSHRIYEHGVSETRPNDSPIYVRKIYRRYRKLRYKSNIALAG